ncbi:glycosyltransferase [Microbacterium kunmingense]|uniref:glycosyltransferase n=1 Tax=Microbacterium kunmingense TaxID=2915939 RepID=UPI002005287C|nr:glycosyltransferase [Microbacterium kunmingense]
MTLEPVWAVITSYRPDSGLLSAIESIRHQVTGVIVVDDGSEPAATPVLEAARATGAMVLVSEINRGIGNALNRGISAAIDAGAAGIVTLDQDSRVPHGFVDALTSAHRRACSTGVTPGPVVPEYFSQVRQAYAHDSHGNLLARDVIQSGMLLDSETVKSLGPMDEDLFIDLVDIEFELRSLDARRPAVAAPGARLEHSLGQRFRRRGPRLPGVPRVMMLSSPFRYYYRARNRVLVDSRYLRTHTRRLIRHSLRDYAYFLIVLTLARPRRSMWRLLSAGFRDGVRGSGGKMPQPLERVAATIRWAADPLPRPR